MPFSSAIRVATSNIIVLDRGSASLTGGGWGSEPQSEFSLQVVAKSTVLLMTVFCYEWCSYVFVVVACSRNGKWSSAVRGSSVRLWRWERRRNQLPRGWRDPAGFTGRWELVRGNGPRSDRILSNQLRQSRCRSSIALAACRSWLMLRRSFLQAQLVASFFAHREQFLSQWYCLSFLFSSTLSVNVSSL